MGQNLRIYILKRQINKRLPIMNHTFNNDFWRLVDTFQGTKSTLHCSIESMRPMRPQWLWKLKRVQLQPACPWLGCSVCIPLPCLHHKKVYLRMCHYTQLYLKWTEAHFLVLGVLPSISLYLSRASTQTRIFWWCKTQSVSLNHSCRHWVTRSLIKYSLCIRWY